MGEISTSPEPLRHIRKVLIANRGEIAVRCIKACNELAVHSIAIFTNVDATSLHAKLADESVLLPGDDGTAYTDRHAPLLRACKYSLALIIFTAPQFWKYANAWMQML